jgi:hypothetical protein
VICVGRFPHQVVVLCSMFSTPSWQFRALILGGLIEQICAIPSPEAHPNMLLLSSRWVMPQVSSTPRPEPGKHPLVTTPIPDFLFPNSKNTKCKGRKCARCAYHLSPGRPPSSELYPQPSSIMRTQAPREEIWARARANGYQAGVFTAKDSRRGLNKHVAIVVKDQDKILRLYTT